MTDLNYLAGISEQWLMLWKDLDFSQTDPFIGPMTSDKLNDLSTQGWCLMKLSKLCLLHIKKKKNYLLSLAGRTTTVSMKDNLESKRVIVMPDKYIKGFS